MLLYSVASIFVICHNLNNVLCGYNVALGLGKNALAREVSVHNPSSAGLKVDEYNIKHIAYSEFPQSQCTTKTS